MLMKLAAVLALAGICVAATGCNTVEGAGKDIKAAGDAIEKSASKRRSTSDSVSTIGSRPFL